LRLPNLMSILGLVVGAIVAVEGILVMAYAAPVTIEGIGGITEQTVLLGGAQLLVLGILLIAAWLLRDRGLRWKAGSRSNLIKRIVTFLGLAIGMIIVLEGTIIAAYAGATMWEGIGDIMRQTVALAGAQLFALGLLTTILWLLKKEMPMGARFAEIIAIVAATGVAAEGLIVMGLAAPTVIEGIGGIMQSTVFVAGVSLFVLGLIGVALWILRDMKPAALNKSRIFVAIEPYLILVVCIAVASVALFVMNHATATTIQGIGGIMARMIMFGGVQLLVLAILQILILGMPLVADSRTQAKTALLASLFLILLVPAALIL
jgi:hypothetical protein